MSTNKVSVVRNTTGGVYAGDYVGTTSPLEIGSNLNSREAIRVIVAGDVGANAGQTQNAAGMRVFPSVMGCEISFVTWQIQRVVNNTYTQITNAIVDNNAAASARQSVILSADRKSFNIVDQGTGAMRLAAGDIILFKIYTGPVGITTTLMTA